MNTTTTDKELAMSATSNDPQTTVSARTFVSNLIVMGSIPPVVPADAITEARKVHGDAYTDEMVEALTELNFVVEGTPVTRRTARCKDMGEHDHDAVCFERTVTVGGLTVRL